MRMDPVIIPELQERDIHTIGAQNKFTWNVEGAPPDPRLSFGGRYIFKWSKEGRDDQKRQLWAEVIASFIGEKLEINIQKSLPARCTINGKEVIGVNCRSFLKEKDDLIHYMDILEKIGQLENKKRGRPHVVPQIFSLFKDTKDFRSSVMEMLFFDSLIGNGDRHPQNWGNKIEAIIRRGKHQASWKKESTKKDTNHMKMCELLWENYPDMRHIMKNFVEKIDPVLKDVNKFMLTECCKCPLPQDYLLSEKRSRFVMWLLKERLLKLKNIIKDGSI